MGAYPHRYEVTADARAEGPVSVCGKGLETLSTTAPPQFGGPEGYWSPETMLVASVANCFILTFRAIARASRVEWESLDCSVDGILDRVANSTYFTEFQIKATLHLPAGGNEAKTRRIMDKAVANCLITNSLKGVETLDATVVIAD